MPDYQQGKIYKLWSPTKNLVYYGSTTRTLVERLNMHKELGCSSKKIFMMTNDYKIELIKNYPCNSKYELELEESKYIENNKCINTTLPACCLIVKNNAYHEHKEKMLPLMKTWKLK
jgi:hypothetical protein